MSDVGLLSFSFFLYKVAMVQGFAWVFCVYGGALMVMNAFLVTITYLHHTHPSLPHYDDSEWNWMKGAFATVDRDYGVLNKVFHNITDTHVLHHLFSYIPHYHAMEATKAIRPILGEFYQIDRTPFALALWRESKNCLFIEPDDESNNKDSLTLAVIEIQVGLLKPQEIGLSDLKNQSKRFRSHNSNSSSTSSSMNSIIVQNQNQNQLHRKNKKKKQRLIFSGCKCTADSIESTIKETNPKKETTKEENINSIPQGLTPDEYSELKSLINAYHMFDKKQNTCTSLITQLIDAPAHVVWPLVRRFDNPQKYKHFIKSCNMIGDSGVGSIPEVIVIFGLPASTSTERLELLDDERHILSFRVVGGEHRLNNYLSVTSVNELILQSMNSRKRERFTPL
ncbi:hypothetical protein L2E82_12540 [Cichorium intybus]|uniref:Uncharacterized protein n=1 Tax=Cichorium intybus TaxID=13427 RepID=A0ACB9GGI1_CICIN|nr:hypothetical protein L2E82_12540 [Cichorium intybus]